MHHSSFILLLLAASVSAQIQVGGSSFTHGTEIVFSSGIGPTESREVGLTIQLEGSVARFAADTCNGTQARLELALRKAAAAGKVEASGALEEATFQALKAGKYLKAFPEDPEAGHHYSWWNYKRDATGKVHCRSHGDFRKVPAEEPEAEVAPGSRVDPE